MVNLQRVWIETGQGFPVASPCAWHVLPGVSMRVAFGVAICIAILHELHSSITTTSIVVVCAQYGVVCCVVWAIYGGSMFFAVPLLKLRKSQT